ncbi:MAG: hypothetical protein ACI35S_05795 [Anaeroplasma sp.]
MQYILNDSLSINETLKKCIPGDIIYLKKGVYKEKVEILSLLKIIVNSYSSLFF